MKRQRLTAIVTHRRPHLEELLAIFCILCDHFSERVGTIFSNLSNVKVLFWDDLPEGTTREEWEAKGYVFIGRWGGKLDEHATLSEPRKEGESAITLVARELGIEQDPKLEKLLQWTSSRDLKLGGGMMELPAVLKLMNDFSWSPDVIWPWVVLAFEALYARGAEHFEQVSSQAGTAWREFTKEWLADRLGNRLSKNDLAIACSDAPNAELFWLRTVPSVEVILKFAKRVMVPSSGNPFEVHAVAEAIARRFGLTTAREWAFTTLDILYQQNKDFREDAANDYKAAKKLPVEIHGRRFWSVIGNSDSLSFSRYARSSFGCKAGLVIVRNSAGNIQIFTDTQLNLDLTGAVEQLRIAELRKKGKPVPTDQTLLRGEAAISDCEEWYFFANGKMVLNGSTTKTRPPTALSLDNVTGIVFASLGVKGFPPIHKRTATVLQTVSAPATA